jgi:hypothetical protein
MFALIGKWNNRVQEISDVSYSLSETEKFYEIETDFTFPDPLIVDTVLYSGGNFTVLSDFPLILIDETWKTSYSDYKTARVALYLSMISKGGWENLSPEEKIIASKWFIVGRSERNQVHSTEDQIINGLTYNSNSIRARKQRLTQCMMEVYNRLDDNQIKSVMSTMDFSRTTYAYTEVGMEGVLSGDTVEGLFDYINSTSGTSWSSSGLRTQSYTPVGYDNCSQLSDRLLDILINGNY